MIAVLPCAGKATRFRNPVVPKSLFQLDDRSILQHVLDEAWASGVKKAVMVINPAHRPLFEYALSCFDLRGEVVLALQEQQLGLGHAILQAKPFVDSDRFAVMLPDEVYAGAPLRSLTQYNEKYSMIATIQATSAEDYCRYGIVGYELGCVLEVVEKPGIGVAPSSMVSVGRYLFTPQLFDHIAESAGEVQLTDAINGMAKTNPGSVLWYMVPHKRYDVGTLSEYLRVASAMNPC